MLKSVICGEGKGGRRQACLSADRLRSLLGGAGCGGEALRSTARVCVCNSRPTIARTILLRQHISVDHSNRMGRKYPCLSGGGKRMADR